jgi:hypothetical protein
MAGLQCSGTLPRLPATNSHTEVHVPHPCSFATPKGGSYGSAESASRTSRRSASGAGSPRLGSRRPTASCRRGRSYTACAHRSPAWALTRRSRPASGTMFGSRRRRFTASWSRPIDRSASGARLPRDLGARLFVGHGAAIRMRGSIDRRWTMRAVERPGRAAHVPRVRRDRLSRARHDPGHRMTIAIVASEPRRALDALVTVCPRDRPDRAVRYDCPSPAPRAYITSKIYR